MMDFDPQVRREPTKRRPHSYHSAGLETLDAEECAGRSERCELFARSPDIAHHVSSYRA
jgi:hypothetical protein